MSVWLLALSQHLSYGRVRVITLRRRLGFSSLFLFFHSRRFHSFDLTSVPPFPKCAWTATRKIPRTHGSLPLQFSYFFPSPSLHIPTTRKFFFFLSTLSIYFDFCDSFHHPFLLRFPLAWRRYFRRLPSLSKAFSVVGQGHLYVLLRKSNSLQS